MAIALRSPFSLPGHQTQGSQTRCPIGQDRCHVFVLERSIDEPFVLLGLGGIPENWACEITPKEGVVSWGKFNRGNHLGLEAVQ